MTYESGPFHVAEVDGAVFLVHRETGESYRIGGSGGRAWELLSGGATIADTIGTIVDETDGEIERVTEDIEALAGALERIGALRPRAVPEP